MRPAEIGSRVLSELRVHRLHRYSSHPEKQADQYVIPANEVVARSVTLVPGVKAAERAKLERDFPIDFELLCDASQKRSKQIVAGEYELLGKPAPITPCLDWNTDPSTGYTWSDEFFGRVSYHKIPQHVDFKNIWELGRQQYGVELSRSWLLNNDLAQGELARDMILSWIDGNPFCKGIHWTSGLEVAMRAISWIWTLANLSEFPAWKDNERERIVESLGLHAHYLENTFSYYSSPYNHVIGEATGLSWIATVLRGTTHATRWGRLANRVLKKFAPQQFYSDGFCVEQAMGYHYYTLGFLILSVLAAKSVDDSKMQHQQIICHALRAGKVFRQPDGCWPAIGDVDSAQSIPVARENYWDFSSLHNLAAAMFNDPTVACKPSHEIDGQGFGDDLYWLLGCDGVQKRIKLQPPEKMNKTTLPAAGYFVAGDDRDHVLFDAGPISAGLFSDSTPSAAHGHADTLQVLYHFNGRSVLCDSGMPNYAGNSTKAAYFRSPEAHNTVSLEGAELVRTAGVLAWSNEVQAPVLRSPDASSLWMASGEVQWPTCRITRHVLAISGEGLWVADYLQSDQSRRATWNWQFPLDIEPKLQQTSGKTIEVVGQGVTLQAVGTNYLQEEKLVSSAPSETAGWVSPGYGVLQPAHRLSYQSQVEGRLLVLTCIGNTKRQIAFEAEGLTVTLPQAGATEGWQRYPIGESGHWLVKKDFVEKDFVEKDIEH